MSSLADLTELVGFFSYSRRDDEHSGGALSRLRARIHDELRLQLGRDLRLWQDTTAIPHGTLWEEQIRSAIGESAFFVPIVTPSAVASEHCKFEFQSFLDRESALLRSDLVFPILFIRVPALASEEQWRQNEVLQIIHSRQYADWTKIRLQEVGSFEVGKHIERFCEDVVDALRRPAVTPEERRARDAAEAQRRADEERRRASSAEAERQRAERDAEDKARQEERRKRDEEARERTRVDAENRNREAQASAATRQSDEVRKGLRSLLALPAWTRWALGALVIGSIGIWLASSFRMHNSPDVAQTPTSPPRTAVADDKAAPSAPRPAVADDKAAASALRPAGADDKAAASALRPAGADDEAAASAPQISTIAAHVTTCAKGSGDGALAACTRVIQSAETQRETVASAYFNRGTAKKAKGDAVGGNSDIATAKRVNSSLGN